MNGTNRRGEHATALAAGFIAVLLVGCSYPNQFRNVRANSPHAVLVGKSVYVTQINQQPPSFWRIGQTYRIPPGPTEVRTFVGSWNPFDMPRIEFTATAGHRYVLTRQTSNQLERVLLTQSASGAIEQRIVAQAERPR